MGNHTKILACRICGCADLDRFHDFGELPLANGYGSLRAEPLELVQCRDCALLQLQHTVHDLFTDYAYAAGTGGMQQEQFQELANEIEEFCQDHAIVPDTVVDIGGNDGSLLEEFKTRSQFRFNVDPNAEGPDIRLRCEWSSEVLADIAYQGADIVVCTNTWAHLPNQQEAAQTVTDCLAEDGVCVIQVPWIVPFFRHCLFDTVYHEHLCYFGVKQFRRLFQPHGIDVVRVDELPDLHGGTIRVWLRHVDELQPQTEAEQVESLLVSDQRNGLTQAKFLDDVDAHINELQYVLGLGPITLYGASAKANMLVHMAGIALTNVVDDTSAKWGRTLPGTGLQIAPPGLFYQDTILLGAWNYKDVIMDKLRGLGWHGRVVVPQPEVEVLTL